VEAPKPPPPPKPARFTADKLDRWFRSDLSYPFALVVASFRTEDRARAFALRLKKEGYPATVAPTDLGKRGRWFRVVLDRYPDIKEAREAARGLKGKKPLGKPWPAKLPFAVEVGRQEDPEAADKSLGELHQRGIMAWVFPEAAGPREPVSFVLLAGAFPTREQAEAYAQELRKSALSAQVVSP
jgi:cell division septation protein DedD